MEYSLQCLTSHSPIPTHYIPAGALGVFSVDCQRPPCLSIHLPARPCSMLRPHLADEPCASRQGFQWMFTLICARVVLELYFCVWTLFIVQAEFTWPAHASLLHPSIHGCVFSGWFSVGSLLYIKTVFSPQLLSSYIQCVLTNEGIQQSSFLASLMILAMLDILFLQCSKRYALWLHYADLLLLPTCLLLPQIVAEIPYYTCYAAFPALGFGPHMSTLYTPSWHLLN